MNKKDKSVLLILILMECLSYVYHRPENLEMFSFIWAFAFFVLLVYRWQAEGFRMYAIASYDIDGCQNLAIAKGNSVPRRKTGRLQNKLSFDSITGLIFLANLLVSIISYR